MSNYIGRDPAPSGVLLLGDGAPVGMMAWFHAPPTGWAQLNGQTLLKASFPDLWAYAQGFLTADQVLNPGLYLSVDAANFKVPNLAGLFIRATGQVDANHVAAALGVKQLDTVGPFNVQTTDFNIVGGAGSRLYRFQPGDPQVNTVQPNGATTETRPVNVGLVPCVKALKTTLIPVTTEGPAFSPGTLVGFAMSNSAIDAVNDIDVLPGKCRGTGDAGNISLGVPLTKQLDVVWALGNNAGMRASGAAIADGTYHVFAIRRPDTGQVDIAADSDVNGANIPANTNVAYTQRRRIGSIIRAAAAMKTFLQVGDEFTWLNPATDDQNIAGGAVAPANFVLPGVPLGIRVVALWKANALAVTTNSGFHRIYPVGQADIPPVSGGGATADVGILANNNGANALRASDSGRTLTNTLGQVRVISDQATGLTVRVWGYIDRRGRDDV